MREKNTLSSSKSNTAGSFNLIFKNISYAMSTSMALRNTEP